MVEASPAPGLQEQVLGSGAGGPLTPPGPWVQYAGYLAYGGGLVVGNASGGYKGLGAVNLKSIFLDGNQFLPSNYLALVGGTMTGPLVLSGDPTVIFGAATKQYVDNRIISVNATFSNYLALAGGTLTGPLTLAGDPTAGLGAATKQYVDNQLATAIQIPDSPHDGQTYGRNNGAWLVIAQSLDMGTY